MKILLFLLFNISFLCHAQFKKQFDFEPSNYVVCHSYENDGSVYSSYDNNEVAFSDSIRGDYQKRLTIYQPQLISSAKNTILMERQVGTNSEGNYFELVSFGDTLYLYYQYVSEVPVYFNFRDPMFSGELVKGDYGEINSDYPLTNEYGEDLMNEDSTDFVYPKIFQMIPHGAWFERIDSSKYEEGLYDDGKRSGIWNTISSEVTTNNTSLILETKEYVDGVLVKNTDHNDLNKDWNKNKQERAIEGEWYNAGFRNWDLRKLKEGGHAYFIFVRDSAEKGHVQSNMLYFLDFRKDFVLTKKTSAKCKVGQLPKNEDEKKDWNYTDSGKLVIDDDEYALIFLNKDKMVLKIEW